MQDTQLRIEGAANVEPADDGWITIWAGPEFDPTALIVDRPGALETARRLTAVAGGQAVDALGGEIERIVLVPPQGAEAPGQLIVRAGGQQVVFWMAWPDLIALSEAAGRAVVATPAEGEA